MEKLSRVKKYEDLRKHIETGDDESQNNTMAQPYNNSLESINPTLFKKMEIKEEEVHTPIREKDTSFNPLELDGPASEFQNEYLDDFINEVREYNIKKGTRECENTQIDILNQLNSQSRPRRSQYVQDIREERKPDLEDTINTMSNEEIAKEVKSLLEQPVISPMMGVQESTVQPKPAPRYGDEPVGRVQESRFEERARMEAYPSNNRSAFEEVTESVQERAQMPAEKEMPQEPVREVHREQPRELPRPNNTKAQMQSNAQPHIQPAEQDDVKKQDDLQRKLVEETQQLRMQMDEYEEELTDLSDGVEKTNKMLNFILCVLIFALLAIIGVVIYWLMQAGGSI